MKCFKLSIQWGYECWMLKFFKIWPLNSLSFKKKHTWMLKTLPLNIERKNKHPPSPMYLMVYPLILHLPFNARFSPPYLLESSPRDSLPACINQYFRERKVNSIFLRCSLIHINLISTELMHISRLHSIFWNNDQNKLKESLAWHP